LTPKKPEGNHTPFAGAKISAGPFRAKKQGEGEVSNWVPGGEISVFHVTEESQGVALGARGVATQKKKKTKASVKESEPGTDKSRIAGRVS